MDEKDDFRINFEDRKVNLWISDLHWIARVCYVAMEISADLLGFDEAKLCCANWNFQQHFYKLLNAYFYDEKGNILWKKIIFSEQNFLTRDLT